MRNNGFLVLFALIAITIAIAIYWPAGGSGVPRVAGSPVTYTELATGQGARVHDRVNYLITSADELRELWKLLPGAKEPPTVDFNKDVVIAIFAGDEPTAGYTIDVSKIADADKRMVAVVIDVPGPTCLAAEQITTPYQVLLVPTTGLDWTHQDTMVTTGCLQGASSRSGL